MPKVSLLCFVSKAFFFFPLLHEVVALLIWEMDLTALCSAVFSCVRTTLCLPVGNRTSALQCAGDAKKPDHEKTSVSEGLPSHFSPSGFCSEIQSELTTGNTKPEFEKFLLISMQTDGLLSMPGHKLPWKLDQESFDCDSLKNPSK